jgi:hypothetical protein
MEQLKGKQDICLRLGHIDAHLAPPVILFENVPRFGLFSLLDFLATSVVARVVLSLDQQGWPVVRVRPILFL